MADVDSDYPLVFVTLTTVNGVRVGGLMLVDTASIHNILNQEIIGILDGVSLGDYGEITLTSFNGEYVKARKTRFVFSIKSEVFDEFFYVADSLCLDSVFDGHVIVGIIGVDFLTKYGLALDYSNYKLRSTTEFDDHDCVIPLRYGFSVYGLPVIKSVSNGMEFGCLADSGSSQNITTRFVLDNYGIVHGRMEKGELFRSIKKVTGGKKTTAKIGLECIGRKSELVYNYTVNEVFGVMDVCRHIVDGKGGILPVSVILGAPFLREHNCVVDFGKMMISIHPKKGARCI